MDDNDDWTIRRPADVMGQHTRLLLVGINPSRRTAETGMHFSGPGNRFWPALRASGLIPDDVGPASQHGIIEHGLGITNLVPRPTVAAKEVTADELRAGRSRLMRLMGRPDDRLDQHVESAAILGVTAFRTAFGRPRGTRGHQPDLGNVFVMDNPSGLNAHATVDRLAAQLREIATAVGLRTTEA